MANDHSKAAKLFGVADPLFLPGNELETKAGIDGQLAMFELEMMHVEGLDRLRAFHLLRTAARNCPNAAYNLANYMSGDIGGDGTDTSPTRRVLANRLLLMVIERGMQRLRDPSEDFFKSPKNERSLRDIISRALTDHGAKLANAGHPDKATVHFLNALRMYPANANAHVCLGNMGVYASAATGIDPLQGIQEWEIARNLEDFESGGMQASAHRSKIAKTARSLERFYGEDTARKWIVEKLVPTLNAREDKVIVSIALDAKDIGRITGEGWTTNAVKVAQLLGNVLTDKCRGRLTYEQKVTVAGCFLSAFARLDTPTSRGDPSILQRALDRASDIETMTPFIGDKEWRYAGPPETNYLAREETAASIFNFVYGAIEDIKEQVPDLKAEDAVLGMLFHIDAIFRWGITSMVAAAVEEATAPYPYVPAIQIGSPPGGH